MSLFADVWKIVSTSWQFIALPKTVTLMHCVDLFKRTKMEVKTPTAVLVNSKRC